MRQKLTDSKCALILGHPGHELRVLGWMKAAKPWVIVLTDGSGHTSEPRVGLTRNLIDEAGALPAEIFGTCTDEQIYKAILAQDFELKLKDGTDVQPVARLTLLPGENLPMTLHPRHS